MKENKIQTKCVNSAYADTTDYDLLAKGNDYIEVTEWWNNEGYVIHICKQNTSGDYSDEFINLTCGQFDAIKHCIKQLNK